MFVTDIQGKFVISVNIDTSQSKVAVTIPDSEGYFYALALYSQGSQPNYTGKMGFYDKDYNLVHFKTTKNAKVINCGQAAYLVGSWS